MQVISNSEILNYCKKRQLTTQFTKACSFIELGYTQTVDLKLLQPKENKIYQFRISRQYRALAIKEGNYLLVFEISDHQ